MALRLGDLAPDFEQDTTEGHLQLHRWLGDSWCVLFSHPPGYAPICTTELGLVARLKSEFDERGVKVIGLGSCSRREHLRLAADVEETQGTSVNYPLIADRDGRIADLYGVGPVGEDEAAVARWVFLIDPHKRLRLISTYPASTGRSFEEILRVVDSIQLADRYGVGTPANWENGDDVIILPGVSSEEARRRFPRGWAQPKPYLRITKQPDL